MDAFQFIEAAKKAQIYLVAKGEKIEVKNASKLTQKSRAFIRMYKHEIIAAISANDELEVMVKNYRPPHRDLPKVVYAFANFLDRSKHAKEPSPKMLAWLGNKRSGDEIEAYEQWLEQTRDEVWKMHNLKQQRKR